MQLLLQFLFVYTYERTQWAITETLSQTNGSLPTPYEHCGSIIQKILYGNTGGQK